MKYRLCLLFLLTLPASATISYVRSAANWTGTSSTECDVSLGTTGTGDLLAVWAEWQTSSGPNTVTITTTADTRSNTLYSAVGPTVQSASNTAGQIFYVKDIGNLGDGVNLSFSGTVASSACVIVEYSGADINYPLDSVSAGYSTASNPTGLLDSGNVAPANSNLMVFGAGIADNASTAMVAGGGFTSLQASHGSWGTGIAESSTAAISGNNTLQRATACIGTGLLCTAADWVMQMAVFRDASWTVQGGWSPVRPGGIRYADQFPGVDIGDQINHAISDLPSTGGEVFVACGTYSLATQISVTTKTVWLHGCGTKGTANVGTHQTTTLNWKGGANQVILVSGTPAQGSKISGIAFDNHGTGTVAIDVDAGAGEIKIEDVGIVQPNTPFSDSGIRLGETLYVVATTMRDVSMYSAAPVGLKVISAEAPEIYNLHITSPTITSSVPSYWVQLGSALGGGGAISLQCYGCVLDGPVYTATYTATPVSLQRVEMSGFYGGYIEQGSAYTATAYSVETTGAVEIRGVNFVGVRFCSCVVAMPSTAAIHQNSTVTQLNLIGSDFVAFASPGGYVLQNDVAPQLINLTHNTLAFNGAALITGSASRASIQSFANVLAGALASPSVDITTFRLGGTGSAILNGESGSGTLIATTNGPNFVAPTIGGGSPLNSVNYYSTSSIVPSAVATATCSDQTFTVSGVAAGDLLGQIMPPLALGNISVVGYVSASNTLLFHFCNPSSTSVTPPSGVYSFVDFR